jgi:hypothetical protein
MSMPVTTGAVAIDDEASTVCWGAVIAGGVAAAAVTLILLAFGVGVGFSVVSPWADQGVSSTTFHVGAGIYLIVVAMLASTIGGYLAGRLRARWSTVHEHEIYFRDTAHGFLAWAVATVLSATVMGAATTHILAGATAGAAPAAATTAANNSRSTDVYVDRMLRSEAPQAGAPVQLGSGAPSQGATQGAGGNASSFAEMGRLIAPVTRKGGEVSAADRAYASKVVMMRTGVSQADADKRVNDTIAEAKKAADDARSAAAQLSLWLAASLLAGALAAMLGATEGGLLRDSRWYEPGWRPGAFGTERTPR